MIDDLIGSLRIGMIVGDLLMAEDLRRALLVERVHIHCIRSAA
jgi:hypothetical protein